MERTIYREIKATQGVWTLGIILLGLVGLAGLSVLYVEHYGHAVTGMNNQIVWGLPHVFAIFLIVAASGALNVASMASVFNNKAYKPLSRLSGILAISLLVGGLLVLVLDLGRPDRLLIAMTTFNFTSIFTWNVLLYTGFIGVVALYLWVQMDRSVHPKFTKPAGILAFVWRLVLTTGTGSIFGWLVARPGYDAAVMAPLFISMSFALGLAVFILVLMALFAMDGRELGEAILKRMTNLLAIFIAVVLYFTAVQHLTNLYAAEHAGIERFILSQGGIYTTLFWGVQIVIGALLPMALIFGGTPGSVSARAGLASVLVIIGGFAQLYVIVVGGQAYPLDTFPGYEVTSSFFDGEIASYTPSVYELALGVGGVAVALIATGLATKVLRILPTNLADKNLEG
ncbi:MAG: polysulfide reductase NrfD [Paracoccaceae bacterium]|jgi:molybdopterin-containing oxidoreductase family membrane subunit|nr:polysulfide reductase NrfD [Paracoccaceae bacterium]MDP7186858.1 polysulfide reductase NrfD [Paracoccaceae bacterium]